LSWAHPAVHAANAEKMLSDRGWLQMKSLCRDPQRLYNTLQAGRPEFVPLSGGQTCAEWHLPPDEP